MTATRHELPPIASPEEWQAARDALLAKEKAHMKAADDLAAERRRLPMVPFTKPYEFDAPEGKQSLLDLFDGRPQLVVYHFMLYPGANEAVCPGCSMIVDNLPHLAHLHARNVTLKVVAPAPLAQIEQFKTRMGWDVPFVSSNGTEFPDDCGVGSAFGVSVFLRDGDDVYRTYFTSGRGGEQFLVTHRYLDVTPLGRQEAWEKESHGDAGPSEWWRLHDEY
jgi:predicted dithiol-disulfide oxidoreductase (DUF899 family)